MVGIRLSIEDSLQSMLINLNGLPNIDIQMKLLKSKTSFKQGNLTFNLYHGRGETDDHTWVHIPEEKIIAPGDLFIWAVPNGGNPQKGSKIYI